MQFDKQLGAFQTQTAGTVPINLITFDSLHYILKYVTLSLPEGYELAMGTQYYILPWYVKDVRAALRADLNSLMIIIYFPLSTENRKHELFQTFAFPSRILNTTYGSFQFDGKYLAICVLQQTYKSLSESNLSQCEGETVRICPVNKSVSSMRTDSCALSLF